MTNLNELDKQIENQTLLKKIKECFDENTSIDEIKPKLHIPILLLHECQITASTTEMSDEYKIVLFLFIEIVLIRFLRSRSTSLVLFISIRK